MPQVSLIIPLFNAVKHIRACLDSVVAQTFGDFEVIMVDDGSTDDTVNIATEYTTKYPNFKLISQNNAGVSSARNYGIETSGAPYVALLDQDDMLHPQALDILYYLIKKYDTDVSEFNIKAVQDSFKLHNPKIYKTDDLEPELVKNPVDYFFATPRGKSIWVWNRLYKREAIKRVEFPIGVQPAEDTVFSLKVLFNVKDIVRVDLPLLYYRNSTTSVMRKGINENYIRSHAKAGEVMYDYFINSGKIVGKELGWMQLYLTRFIFKSLVSQPLRLIKKDRNDLINLSRDLFAKLQEEGAIEPRLLGLKKALACYFFFKKRYWVASLLLV